MKSYRFPVRIKRIEAVISPEIAIRYTEDRRTGPIHGQEAGSFAEWVVALALWYLKTSFIYKYNIPNTRFVIDFYIDAGPDWVPVDVRKFWGYAETSVQRFRRRAVEQILNRTLAVIWDYQVSTFEEAITTVRRVMG